MDCNLDSNKSVKSQYKYRIISKSCKGRDFTNIDRYRIISSVILLKISKIISIDICIDFRLNDNKIYSVFIIIRPLDFSYPTFR